MDLVDGSMDGIVAAVVGAVVGSAGGWLAHRQLSESTARQKVVDKIHELELRILKLEVQTDGIRIQGQVRLSAMDGEPDA